jgi:tetratricopeptide (TPR) repeat protein
MMPRGRQAGFSWRRVLDWLGCVAIAGSLLGGLAPLVAIAGTAVDAGRMVPLRMIVVRSEREAREITASVNKGVPFERLARERSIGAGRERGGYLGRVSPATLSPEAQAALARVGKARLSPIFRAEGGYAVLQVVPESVARLLDESGRYEAEAERLLEEGTEAGRQGEIGKAAELLARAVLLNPSQVDAHYNLAIAYRRLGQMPQAIAAMRRVVELKPDDFEARMGLGRWLSEADQHKEASVHLERAVMLHTDSREAWQRLGQSYEAVERYRDALGAYRRVLTLLGKDDPVLLVAILRTAMRSQDGATAVEMARKLQALTPGHRGFLLVGRALLVKGDLQAAAQELEKAVALEPSSVPARLSLSEAYGGLGRAEAAADQMLRVIRLEPGKPEHYRILSERYEEAGRLDLAIVAMRDCVNVAESGPQTVQAEMSARLALLYELAGMTREAARERQRAESLQAPVR